MEGFEKNIDMLKNRSTPFHLISSHPFRQNCRSRNILLTEILDRVVLQVIIYENDICIYVLPSNQYKSVNMIDMCHFETMKAQMGFL